jgi:hypothetical protein
LIKSLRDLAVKHLTLDSDAIGDICDGITADRIVIVCKESDWQSCCEVPKSKGGDAGKGFLGNRILFFLNYE